MLLVQVATGVDVITPDRPIDLIPINIDVRGADTLHITRGFVADRRYGRGPPRHKRKRNGEPKQQAKHPARYESNEGAMAAPVA